MTTGMGFPMEIGIIIIIVVNVQMG